MLIGLENKRNTLNGAYHIQPRKSQTILQTISGPFSFQIKSILWGSMLPMHRILEAKRPEAKAVACKRRCEHYDCQYFWVACLALLGVHWLPRRTKITFHVKGRPSTRKICGSVSSIQPFDSHRPHSANISECVLAANVPNVWLKNVQLQSLDLLCMNLVPYGNLMH